MKPLGDGFIKLIKMMIAPIIFTTVVVGIAKMGDMKEVGRVGLKALIYFEVVSSLALVIGLVVVNVVRRAPGSTPTRARSTPRPLTALPQAPNRSPPWICSCTSSPNPVGAFASGEILQVLLFSVLFGLALARLGEKAGS